MQPMITMNSDASSVPARLLHVMLRVADLDRSVAFYTVALGMYELRREEYPQGRFTLVFLGYGEETQHTVIELTYNWDVAGYERGTGFGHVALAVADIHAAIHRLSSMGVTVIRQPAPMSFVLSDAHESEMISFIEDPDGYRIELIEKAA